MQKKLTRRALFVGGVAVSSAVVMERAAAAQATKRCDVRCLTVTRDDDLDDSDVVRIFVQGNEVAELGRGEHWNNHSAHAGIYQVDLPANADLENLRVEVSNSRGGSWTAALVQVTIKDNEGNIAVYERKRSRWENDDDDRQRLRHEFS